MRLTTAETKRVNALITTTRAAKEAGIRSPMQLEIFLMCLAREGETLSDIVNLPTDTPEYKTKYTLARQLMMGAANRGYNGANLLQWGDNLYGKEKAVLLTPKGERLALKILTIS